MLEGFGGTCGVCTRNSDENFSKVIKVTDFIVFSATNKIYKHKQKSVR